MAITSFKGLVNAEEAGQTFFGGFRKVPNAATGAGSWFDLTLSPGNPLPFYYASTPLVGASIGQATNGGIPHNPPVASFGYKTYLKTLNINPGTSGGGVNGMMILMDYLFYYPFVDTGVTDPQTMTNTASLTRYTSGAGVQVIAVQLAGMLGSGNPTFRFTYTNQDGILQTSPTQTCGSASLVGQLATSNNNTTSVLNSNFPFLALVPGDTGVRNIQSVTFDAPDIGLLAFVLVKPLEHITLREAGAPAERTPALDFFDLPVIADNAYLSLLVNTGTVAASAAPFFGTIQTVWG